MRKDVEGARWKLHAEGCGWCTLEAAYGRMWKAHAGKERLVFTCFTYERLAFQRLLSVCFEAPQAFSKIFPSRHHAAPGLKRENYTENSVICPPPRSAGIEVRAPYRKQLALELWLCLAVTVKEY